MRACPQCLTVYEGDPEFCAFDGAHTAAFVKGVDPLAGLELDRYTLRRRLGIGGTGCVYLAHGPDGESYAIKLLFGEMATDKSLALRFRREADAMRRIDHPNVVKVVETRTSAAGLTYLVMEYVEGRTLKAVIEREAPLAPGRVGRLAEQLVAGLARAHHLGYVHRDLKPSNVMISGEPGSEVARILDFGIVACLRTDEPDSRLTKTGYIVGTPTYMAPEQIDAKQVTPQADVYALGVILYEMLAGDPPFTGTLEQILVSKMTAAAPALEGVGELGPFVAGLLAMDPADRPANALHVSAELSRMSLLSPDPATEKARAWDLPDLGHVGFGAQTVAVDRTDESPLPSARGTATAPTALDEDTPGDGYTDFGANTEAPTTAAPPRRDTLLDPTGRVAPPSFPENSAPTKPATAPEDTVAYQAVDRDPFDETGDDDLEGDGPTRVAAVSGFGLPAAFPDDTPVDRTEDASTAVDGDTDESPAADDTAEAAYVSYGPYGADRSRPASEASARRVDAEPRDVSSRPRVAVWDAAADDARALGAAATQIDPAHVHDTALDHAARVDLVPAVAMLGEDTAPHSADVTAEEEDEGFADTRIRPSHIVEGTAPEWSALPQSPPEDATSPVAGFVTVRPVPIGIDAAGAAPTAIRRSPSAPELPVPESAGDDPTALSALAQATDPGDADTALDLMLEERVGGVSTDLAVDRPAAAGAAPPAGATSRSRPTWLLGLLVAGLLVTAAAVTYALLDTRGTVVIDRTAPEGAAQR